LSIGAAILTIFFGISLIFM